MRTLKLLVVALMAALGLLVAGPAVTASAATYSISQDQIYLTTLAQNGVYVPRGEEYVATSLGHTIADSVAVSPTFATLSETAANGLNAGFSPDDTGALMYASIYAYQPRYLPLLMQWASAVASSPSSGINTV